MPFPEIVSQAEWLEARVSLLGEEKAETRRRDKLNTRRRKMPMVRIEKDYVFQGSEGQVSLAALFGASMQLIVQHIMFGPDWDAVCPSCANSIDELSEGLIAHLRARDTAFVLVSRAPFGKLEEQRLTRGWRVAPWYPSYESDFNYDFQVTLDRTRQLVYNYRSQPELIGDKASTEMPGHSFFLRAGGDVFHTYSTFGRGNEYTPSLYTLLDLTTLGRQEAWEEPKDRAPFLHDT